MCGLGARGVYSVARVWSFLKTVQCVSGSILMETVKPRCTFTMKCDSRI